MWGLRPEDSQDKTQGDGVASRERHAGATPRLACKDDPSVLASTVGRSEESDGGRHVEGRELH